MKKAYIAAGILIPAAIVSVIFGSLTSDEGSMMEGNMADMADVTMDETDAPIMETGTSDMEDTMDETEMDAMDESGMDTMDAMDESGMDAMDESEMDAMDEMEEEEPRHISISVGDTPAFQ